MSENNTPASTPAPEASAPAENTANEPTENTEIEVTEGESEDQESVEARSDAEIDADKNLSKKEKAAEKRLNKLKIKFNGKEMEEDLPFDIPDTPEAQEYMRKHIQMSKLSQSKAQEYASLEKQALEFIQALQEDPEAVLADPRVGVDVQKFAAKIIEKQIANSKKTPEQLELERTQAELRAIKQQREHEAKTRKEQEFQANVERLHQEYETQLKDGLAKHSIPDSDVVRGLVVNFLEEAATHKIKVSVADVIPLVKEELQSNLKTLVASLSPEQLEDFIGKEVLSNYRKNNMKKVKEKQAVPTPLKAAVKDTGKTGKAEEKAKELVSYKDFFKI